MSPRPRAKRSAHQASSSTVGLFTARLAESGLNQQDATTLGIHPVDLASSLCPSFEMRAALVLPYLDPRTKAPSAPNPSHPPFYRIRYLGPPPPGFSALTTKPHRYAQPPGSGVMAYFPANVDWPALFKASDAILITEGELKAAKACRDGFPTIGLGGVYNWRSAKQGVPFLPELEAVPWLRRPAYLVFDSDVASNPMVAAALNQLAHALYQRGALPHVVILPALGGKKTGLDDFLVASSPQQLDELLVQATPLTLAQPLFDFNDELVYVRDPGLVVLRDSGQKLTPAAFTSHAYANRIYHERTIGEDGKFRLKPVSAANKWLSWPARAEAARLTYSPGQPAEVLEDGELRVNLWKGWAVEPKKGDVKPFLRMVDHVFTGGEPEAVTWFLRWLAYPLQHPGAKLHSSVLLWSPIQGVGKSLFGYTMKRVYGANFVEIGQGDLESSFTEWAENKQFVLGDEVTGSDRRAHSDKLKRFITQETMRINVKMIPSYAVPDRINYLFTSNHPDAFFLDDQDRRYFVHEVIAVVLPDAEFAKYFRWLDHEGGAAAVFDHLLHLDLGNFNPKGWAFRTAARERMVADGRSDLAAWIASLKTDPDGLLRLGGAPIEGELFTARELFDLYDPAGRTRATAGGLSRSLRAAGFRQVCEGAPFRAGDDRLEKFFAVRNVDAWNKLAWKTGRAEVEKHLDQRYNRAPAGAPPKKSRY